MNPTQIHAASPSTVEKRLAELGSNPDPAWRIKGFSATATETGGVVIGLTAGREPNSKPTERINGGKVLVLPADKMQAKLDEMAADPECGLNVAASAVVMLPGKKAKGSEADEPAPPVAHVAVLLLA